MKGQEKASGTRGNIQQVLSGGCNLQPPDHPPTYSGLGLEKTKGQQAMAVALAYPEATKYKRGGSILSSGKNQDAPSEGHISKARFVLRHCRDKAERKAFAAEVGRISQKLQGQSNQGDQSNFDQRWLIDLADKSGLTKQTAYNWWSAFCKETGLIWRPIAAILNTV